MQDAWLAFARTGDPTVAGAVPWPRYDLATRPTLELGEVVRPVNDPSKERREPVPRRRGDLRGRRGPALYLLAGWRS